VGHHERTAGVVVRVFLLQDCDKQPIRAWRDRGVRGFGGICRFVVSLKALLFPGSRVVITITRLNNGWGGHEQNQPRESDATDRGETEHGTTPVQNANAPEPPPVPEAFVVPRLILQGEPEDELHKRLKMRELGRCVRARERV
jgi:hypothetical protein